MLGPKQQIVERTSGIILIKIYLLNRNQASSFLVQSLAVVLASRDISMAALATHI